MKPACGRVLRYWRGIVHHHDGNLLVGSRGDTIFLSTDGGMRWSPVMRVPARPMQRLLASHRLTRRLFRQGIHHILHVVDDRFSVFAFGRVYDVSLRGGSVVAISAPIVGSRPLIPCVYNGRVLYGEYRSNDERTRVCVYGRDFGGYRWEEMAVLDNVRHIHGIFCDPYDDAFYITTGDRNEECIIWRWDIEGGGPVPIVGGTQQCRVVQLLIDREYFYFGTDAPGGQNAIYRMRREQWEPERMVQIGGPVFYGMKVPCGLLMGTVVEPSDVNYDPCSRVYLLRDGQGWSEIAAFKKDIMPKKLFQYGQVRFPAGAGASGVCWLTPVATVGDQISICYDLLS